MTARVLPLEEWDRLPESLDPTLMCMRPATSRVCVVEQDGKIEAHMLLYPVLMVGSVHIAGPRRKKGVVFGKLRELLTQAAIELDVSHAVACSQNNEVVHIVNKMGGSILDGLPVIFPIGRVE